MDPWEVVIGLEVHTHLRTASKLFSPAPVTYGAAPNHSVHPIDLALPGVLPVLNERVVELAIRLGLAIHATVNPHSVFARKNYFYPDLPKGYQISQFEEPLVSGGWIEIEVEGGEGKKGATRRIGVTRAHLEEDAGKSVHDMAVAGRRVFRCSRSCRSRSYVRPRKPAPISARCVRSCAISAFRTRTWKRASSAAMRTCH